MPELPREIRFTYRPRDGPRRRVTFTPDPSVESWEFGWWRVEEAYETDEGYWREVGREHVDAPTVTIDGDTDAEVPADVP